MRLRRLLAAALVLGLAVPGCGGGPQLLKTRGRVVKGGTPFLPGPGEFVRVTFVPLLPAGQPVGDYYVAEYDSKDGTFRVAGKDRRGMPPGKYRVAVELDRRRSDLLKGKFDAENSPFVFDVDGSTDEIVIDLDRPPAKT
jgi:hypothetical protein